MFLLTNFGYAFVFATLAGQANTIVPYSIFNVLPRVFIKENFGTHRLAEVAYATEAGLRHKTYSQEALRHSNAGAMVIAV